MARSFCYGLKCLTLCIFAVAPRQLALAVESDAGTSLSAADEEALRDAKQGAVVKLDLMGQRGRLPRAEVEIHEVEGPQFLFSDRPEYFYTGNGIALQEKVKPGMVRLYLYHVPEPTGEKRVITAVIENQGSTEMKLRFLRRAFPAPGTDYQKIAKEGLKAFLSATSKTKALMVPAGEGAVLDSRMDQALVTKNQLVHGFYEFEIDQPARVSVFQRNPDQVSVQAMKQLPKLPRVLPGKEKGNGAGRGIFPTCNFIVTNAAGYILDTTNGPVQLVVADGRREGWISGHDGIENKDDARDAGNYGVMYKIRLKWAANGGKRLALLMCNLSSRNQWCGRVAAAVEVNEGLFPGGVVELPIDRAAFGEGYEAVLIQKFAAPPKGKTGTIELIYSPPGAACIPTPLLLVPCED